VGQLVELDGRPYVVDPKQISRVSANQMAAKVGQGAGKYDDQLIWDSYLWDNWQAGEGQRDPTAGGFLHSTAETRFEGQISLPPRLALFGDGHVPQDNYDAKLTIGTGQTYTKASFSFSRNTDTTTYATVLLPGALYEGTATQAIVSIYSDTAGSPNASVQAATTITLQNDHGWFYHHVEFSLAAPGSPTTYHLVIEPAAGTMTLLADSDLPNGKLYNGATWVAGVVVGGTIHTDHNGAAISKICSFNGEAIMSAGVYLLRLNTVNTWTQLSSFLTDITDLLPIGNTLYVGLGDSTNYQTMDTSDVFTPAGVPARLLSLWKGFLYRAVGNDIYYTADEVTWRGPFEVCYSKYSIRGLAGFGNDMYIACDDGLYRLAPGDIVQSVHRFPSVSSTNGKHILNWQGQLYFNLGASLIRFDGTSFLPMGPDLNEGLPAGWNGNIAAITASNNWLVCGVAGTSYSSLWGHNGQGWHFLQRVPISTITSVKPTLTAAAYLVEQLNGVADAWYGTNVIGFGALTGVYYSFRLPDTGRSTYRLAQSTSEHRLHPSATIEIDQFHGGLLEVYKDFESIYLDGDGLSATSYVDVYWQDEGSSDWELLGRFSAGDGEERWSSILTRPNSRWLKWKLVMVHLTPGAPPRIVAIRAKFQNMVIDRFRWTLPLEVSSEQQMIDGDRNWYNHDEQLEHLDSLLTRVPPWVYTDTDGLQYEVKMLTHTRQPNESQGDDAEIPYTYVLVIEQANAGTYESD
jgi:hypothetical protein